MTEESNPLPILLVVLDGLADRPYPELGGRTPLEAASTPTMDRLAGEGQSGFCYPLGPGRIPSTELVHFRFFGYEGHYFPGRACLEALGADVSCAAGDVFVFLALRRVKQEPGGNYVPKGTIHFVRVYSGWEEEKVRRLKAQGFAVEVLGRGEEKAISGKEVRRLIQAGLAWEHLVSPAAVPLIHDTINREPRRFGAPARGESRAAGRSLREPPEPSRP